MLNTLCRLCGFALIAVNVFGCSTFKPQPDATASFMERKQLKKAGEVSVSMAVPPAEESAAVFGVKVAKKKIQPIWLEIDNQSVFHGFPVPVLSRELTLCFRPAAEYCAAENQRNHSRT